MASCARGVKFQVLAMSILNWNHRELACHQENDQVATPSLNLHVSYATPVCVEDEILNVSLQDMLT